MREKTEILLIYTGDFNKDVGTDIEMSKMVMSILGSKHRIKILDFPLTRGTYVSNKPKIHRFYVRIPFWLTLFKGLIFSKDVVYASGLPVIVYAVIIKKAFHLNYHVISNLAGMPQSPRLIGKLSLPLLLGRNNPPLRRYNV